MSESKKFGFEYVIDQSKTASKKKRLKAIYLGEQEGVILKQEEVKGYLMVYIMFPSKSLDVDIVALPIERLQCDGTGELDRMRG